MKINRIFLILFLGCIIVNTHGFAKSPVWKISKDGYHLFLGGTIHLLNNSDYPLPGAFETAYNNSTILVLETDLEKFNAPEFQQTILQKAVYTGNKNITHFLEPETMHALDSYLTSRGIPKEHILKLKPGLLSLTLTVVELQRLGLVGTGVDEFFQIKGFK